MQKLKYMWECVKTNVEIVKEQPHGFAVRGGASNSYGVERAEPLV